MHGITDMGENKPQELARKYEIIGDKVKMSFNWKPYKPIKLST